MADDASDRNEPVDLSPEQRARIDRVFAQLAATDLYELLGITRSADKKGVKRAYGGRVMEFHPDRFFSKRLGAYKPKLEAIIRRMTEAHDVLCSTEERASYDATLPAERTSLVDDMVSAAMAEMADEDRRESLPGVEVRVGSDLPPSARPTSRPAAPPPSSQPVPAGIARPVPTPPPSSQPVPVGIARPVPTPPPSSQPAIARPSRPVPAPPPSSQPAPRMSRPVPAPPPSSQPATSRPAPPPNARPIDSTPRPPLVRPSGEYRTPSSPRLEAVGFVSVDGTVARLRDLHGRHKERPLAGAERIQYDRLRGDLLRLFVAAQRLSLRPGQTPRRALRVACAVKLALRLEGVVHPTETLDLSTGGLAALVDVRPSLGAPCELALDAGARPIRVRARVVAVTKIGPPPQRVRLSLAFERLDEAEAARVEELVLDQAIANLRL